MVFDIMRKDPVIGVYAPQSGDQPDKQCREQRNRNGKQSCRADFIQIHPGGKPGGDQ